MNVRMNGRTNGHMNGRMNGRNLKGKARGLRATSPRRPAGGREMTFLFTDIERSTECWERDPETMHQVMLRHNRVLMSIVAEHGGKIFKTVGDAILAAFSDAGSALAAAAQAQREIAAVEWHRIGSGNVEALRIRIGLHSGKALEVENDFFGTVVCGTARITDASRGGQTLLSGETLHRVEGRVPEGCLLKDWGVHRLRGLSKPVRIVQLIMRDLPVIASKPRTAGTVADVGGSAQGVTAD